MWQVIVITFGEFVVSSRGPPPLLVPWIWRARWTSKMMAWLCSRQQCRRIRDRASTFCINRTFTKFRFRPKIEDAFVNMEIHTAQKILWKTVSSMIFLDDVIPNIFLNNLALILMVIIFSYVQALLIYYTTISNLQSNLINLIISVFNISISAF